MGDGVGLRPVREDDLALLERLTNDPGAAGPHDWHGWRDPHLWQHRWSENGLVGSAGGTLVITRGGDPAGFVSWRQVSSGPISHCWELGISIAPEARGQGVGSQGQRLIARYLFAYTQANRVQAVTDVENLAEQRALEKAGFSREAVLREFGYRDGRWHDAVLYSVLRKEVDLGEDR